MVCLKHPDREAVTVCAACRKPLCAECVAESGENGTYCSAECLERGTVSGIRAAGVISSADRVDRNARKRFWLWFILLLLIGGGVWFFYHKNQKTVDKWVSDKSSSIRKSADKAIREGKDRMPKDSKYKREREQLVK